MSQSHFLLVRKYLHHRKYPDLKKVIAYAKNFRDQICNDLVFLQYFFTGEIHSIKGVKHGNAKKATHNYSQTKPSVLEKAKRDINSPAVRSVAANVNDIGGVKHANNPADMITTKQLHDMKYNQSKSTGEQPQTSEDEISDIIDMGQNEFKFIIREIKQFPEPFIVLATDEQLNDLERFSCDDAEFITMSVDPTFKIGKFNVTPISFRNLTLSIDCEHVSCPVVMGPLLVHFSKTEEIYTAFFQTLLRLRPSLSLLKAYGTDGETALCNALGKVFPEATSLRCFKHVESNIKMKISELRLSKNESRFLDDIFYGESALLESENGAQFDNLFMEIEKTWAVLDVSGKFTQYIKTLVPMMKTSMIAPVRTRAGLGFPPS